MRIRKPANTPGGNASEASPRQAKAARARGRSVMAAEGRQGRVGRALRYADAFQRRASRA